MPRELQHEVEHELQQGPHDDALELHGAHELQHESPPEVLATVLMTFSSPVFPALFGASFCCKSGLWSNVASWTIGASCKLCALALPTTKHPAKAKMYDNDVNLIVQYLQSIESCGREQTESVCTGSSLGRIKRVDRGGPDD